MPRKLHTLQMAFIKSSHEIATFQWWTIPILMALEYPLLTVMQVSFAQVAHLK